MNKFMITLVLLSLPLILLGAFKLNYFPLNKIDQNTHQLRVNILENDTDISKVQVFFKFTDQDTYQSFEIDNHVTTNNEISIPIQQIISQIDFDNNQVLQYYIVFNTADGGHYTLPEVNPEFNPYSASIIKNDYKDAFIFISPEEVEEAKIGDKLIISYFSIKDLLDPQQIKVMLDNRDITKQATIEGNLIVMTINESMKNGALSIESVLNNGDKVESLPISFKKIAKKSNFSVYGNGTFISNYNNVSTDYDSLDLESKHDEVGIFNVTANYKRIFWKNYFYISSLEDKDNQSINRYYTGFVTPYLDLHIGDYSPNLSEFTMYNRNVRGFSGKIKTNPMTITGIYGETARKIGSKSDSTSFRAGTFKRQTIGAKISFGNSDRFKFGLNFVKNKDDINSLDSLDYTRVVTTVIDSLTNETETDTVTYKFAKDNIIFGADFDFELIQSHLTIFGEIAMSMYNSNINPGVITKDSLENYIDASVPFDPEAFEGLFLINKNIEPFQAGLNNTAFKTGLRLNFWRNSLMASYSQIGPSFYSLSSTGVSQDFSSLKLVDNLIVSPSFYISGGFEQNNDNIVDQKDNTTTSTTYYVVANYQPVLWPYFSVNFSNSDLLDDKAINDSSFYFDQNYQSIQFNTGYTYSKMDLAQITLDLQYGIGADKDHNPYTHYFDNSRNDLGLNTIIRFKDLPLITRSGVMFNTNDNINNNLISETVNFTTFYLNNEYTLHALKLTPYLNFKLQSKSGDFDEYSTYQFNIGSKYEPFRRTWMLLDIGYKNYDHTKSLITVEDDYSNFFTKFTINTSF